MRITYDKLADAMSIRFNQKRSAGVQPVNDFVNVRLADDGTIISIELLAVSKYANDIDDIIKQYDIEKVLEVERAAGHVK